ncbi:MAG: D-alanine--D-alanine ligase family protein [Patescibacteria group bacterium]|jgi:D-alanine-D-alanine ligase
MKKIKVGIFFGSISPEHQVSLWSAQGIIKNIDRTKFQVQEFWIDKKGIIWQANNALDSVLKKQFSKLKNADLNKIPAMIDVAFPVLHGKGGEDGTIQGFFETLGVTYVGADVPSSTICLDKGIFNQLMSTSGLPKPKFVILNDITSKNLSQINRLKYPLFVKPARTGSSVGISKVASNRLLLKAINKAKKFDNKIVIEETIKNCKEIEISVLGNSEKNYKVTLPGRVIPHNDFYNYNDKYLDNHASFELPAKLPLAKIKEIQIIALTAYKIAGCRGLARVDFLLDRNLKVYLNEINTLPGFTPISLYPKLWEISGIPYKELITKLIKLAL